MTYNIDKETGIRYGVISQHTVGQAWYDDAKPDYGEPHCPKCGNDAISADNLTEEQAEEFEEERDYIEYACLNCRYQFGTEHAFGEDPRGWYIDDGEYQATDCLDTDIMILKSPYFTYAPFCSPCVPGAGNLDHLEDRDMNEDTGVKAYCFGHDWFEEGKAPYRVYDVKTGELVEPKGE